MATPGKFIAGLQRLLMPLETADKFFTAPRGSAYLAVLREVTVAYLLGRGAPRELTPERWESAVMRFAQGIQVERLSSGFRFAFEGVPLADEQGEAIAGGSQLGVDLITFADIEAWIQAGVEGDPLGKRIQPGEDLDEAAHLIYTAVHGKARKDGSRSSPSTKGPHVRLRAAIREWMDRSPYGFGRHVPALRQVWKEALRDRYRTEMREFIRATVRRG